MIRSNTFSRRIAASLADSLLLITALLLVWIIVSGGAVFTWHDVRVSATGVDNLLLALTGLLFLRYVSGPDLPIVIGTTLTPRGLASAARDRLPRLATFLDNDNGRDVPVGAALLTLTAVTLIAKLLLALRNPGFFSGDDVEVQEMALRAIKHATWPIWDLRNAFFPMVFVYPIERLGVWQGVTSEATLVFLGRCAVAILSSLAVLLTWAIARGEAELSGWWPTIAAAMFAISKLHVAFGSSELPRPVSTLFVIAAFLMLRRCEPARATCAGVCLGLAFSFRFSEITFAALAMVQLLIERRYVNALVVGFTAALTGAAVVGISDLWYWGTAFHSVAAAVDYTLVHRLSSRGYQAPWWYVSHCLEWLNPATAVLSVVALVRRRSASDLWAWGSMVILSALPHKEARYLIPTVPFVCIGAARGLKYAIRAVQTSEQARPQIAASLGLACLCGIGIAQDVGHWRLPRSNGDVAFVVQATPIIPTGTVIAAEQAWRLGGHLYLDPHPVRDLDPGRLSQGAYLRQNLDDGAWLIVDSRTSNQPEIQTTLDELKYTEVPVRLDASRYRLWRPRDK